MNPTSTASDALDDTASVTASATALATIPAAAALAPPPAPAEIEALADSLSDSANALHKRIMAALRRNASGGGEAIAHAEAQALFEQEIALRQQANALYADATRFATGSMAEPARELLGLAARARERIRRIDRVKDLAGIASALLNAAAAIAALRPEALAPALEDLKEHIEALPETDKTASLPAGTRHTMDT